MKREKGPIRMKKLLVLLLAAALAVTAAFVLTACSAKEDAPEEEVSAVTAVDDAIGSPPPVNTPDMPANSLAELVAQQNAAVEAANAAAAGQYKIEVKADGKKLVYAYTYAIELPAEALQASLDAAGASYGGQFASYKSAGYDIDAVVIQFLDQSGKVIASKEFN